MKCPECGAECWRNEVDVGVGIIRDEWKCTECSWDEGQAFANWEDFLDFKQSGGRGNVDSAQSFLNSWEDTRLAVSRE